MIKAPEADGDVPSADVATGSVSSARVGTGGASRVLVLSPFFFPEPISTGRYNLTMAEGLLEAGCDVSVACCHPFYPEWKVERSEAQLPGMRIERGGGWLRFPGSPVVRRAVLECWFAVFATMAAWRRRRLIDTVVAVVPPSLFFLGVSAVLSKRVRRVAVIHDLQGVHAEASGSRPTRALVGVIGAIERRVFRACDRLVVLSEAMGEKLIETTGVARDRITVVYPFVNLPEPKPGVGRLAAQFPEGFVHLVYSGALGEKQNPRQMVEIFDTIARTLPGVMIHVFSNGPAFESMKATLSGRGLANLTFQPLVPDEDVAELYARADIQLIPQAAGTQHGSMPSKLPNILASGRRILAICDADSELATMIARFNAGECLSSWEPDVVRDALARLVGRLRDGTAPPFDGAAARALFSLDRLTAALIGDPHSDA